MFVKVTGIPPRADARGRPVCFLGNMRTGAAAFLIVLSVACSSSNDGDAPPVTCKLGELDGTWQVTYVEKDGTCGKIADETVVLSPGAAADAQSKCTYNAQSVSPDKCRIDLDYTCPLATGAGSQHWVGALRHVADARVLGSMSVQVVLGGQTCRSTYDVTWTRQ